MRVLLRQTFRAFALMLLLLPGPCLAQSGEDPARNSIYLEVLGNGGLYSVNFDRKVSDHLSLRFGVAAWSSESFFGTGRTEVVSLPVMANVLIGRGSHRLETGVGFLFGRSEKESGFGESDDSTFANLTATVGYRYQPPGAGIVFRVGFTPFYSLNNDDDAYPDPGFFASGGISAGYSF